MASNVPSSKTLYARILPGLLLFTSTICFSVSALGATWLVDKSGADDRLCGAAKTPCLTIQHAINLAAPNDNILVGPGIYPEAISIERGKSGLALVSIAGNGATIIDASRLSQNAIYVNSSHVRIGSIDAGFTIRTTDEKSSRRGIRLNSRQCKGIVIEGNVISGFRQGIFAKGQDHLIQMNRVSQNLQQGIYCYQCQTSQISDNYVVENAVGIQLGQAIATTVERNDVFDNRQSGILIAESSQGILVQSNNTAFNRRHGIELENLRQNSVLRNIATSNGGNGFDLTQDDKADGDLLVRGNLAQQNLGSGFVNQGIRKMRFESNIANQNGADGIQLLQDLSFLSFNNNTSINSKAGCGINNLSDVSTVFSDHYFGQSASDKRTACGTKLTGTFKAEPTIFMP